MREIGERSLLFKDLYSVHILLYKKAVIGTPKQGIFPSVVKRGYMLLDILPVGLYAGCGRTIEKWYPS